MPLSLTAELEFQMIIATNSLHRTETGVDFSKTILTADESWVYGYEPEIKV